MIVCVSSVFPRNILIGWLISKLGWVLPPHTTRFSLSTRKQSHPVFTVSSCPQWRPGGTQLTPSGRWTWLGWHSGLTFFFDVVSPLLAGYWHHSLQSNYYQQEKKMHLPVAFTSKHNEKALGTVPQLLCYVYAKRPNTSLSQMTITVPSRCPLLILSSISNGSERKFAAFSFSLSIWAPHLSLTLWWLYMLLGHSVIVSICMLWKFNLESCCLGFCVFPAFRATIH